MRTATAGLTPVQQTIMALLAEGISNKEIARRLDCSPETISTHLTRAKKKLGAETPRKAVLKYIRDQYAGWAGEIEYLSWGRP